MPWEEPQRLGADHPNVSIEDLSITDADDSQLAGAIATLVGGLEIEGGKRQSRQDSPPCQRTDVHLPSA